MVCYIKFQIINQPRVAQLGGGECYQLRVACLRGFQAACLADFHIIHRPAVRVQFVAGGLGERGEVVVACLRGLGDGLQGAV